MNKILGINGVYHESAVALVQDDTLRFYMEEERLNRIKHGKISTCDGVGLLPSRCMQMLEAETGITLGQIDQIGYSFIPQSRFDFNRRCQYAYIPETFGNMEREQQFKAALLEIPSILRAQGFRGEFHFLSHHDCHAANAFLTSPFSSSLVIVVDGCGEHESTSVYAGENGSMEKLWSQSFPNSLGLLWEKVSLLLGFSIYDACKTMGLAAYGRATNLKEKFRELVEINPDGSYLINDSLAQLRSSKCEVLRDFLGNRFKNEDVAAALQDVTNEIVFNLASYWKKQTRMQNLCMAGGVALNCATNGLLLKSRLFENFFIPPTANDAGTALGAAALLNKKRFVTEYPYLSPVVPMLYPNAVAGLKIKSNDASAKEIAELIVQGKIVALFQGRMEAGPRALGNRSLLADPRALEIREILNRKIKHREEFRPLCPTILAEYAADFFDFTTEYILQYMLAAIKIRKEKIKYVPAIVHQDETCRVQVLSRAMNPFYYDIIDEFRKITDIPMLLNTSFNDREPIVFSPEDALKTFLRTGIDVLVLEGKMFVKD